MNIMERKEKKALKKRIVAVLAELVALGMDEIEIMNFWEKCLIKAKKNDTTL